MATVYNGSELDCPIVPQHLSHRISQANWDWINKTTIQLYNRYIFNTPSRHIRDITPWMIRGYWLVTYFMNPSENNLSFMILNLRTFQMLTNNLELLEFVDDLKSRVKSC